MGIARPRDSSNADGICGSIRPTRVTQLGSTNWKCEVSSKTLTKDKIDRFRIETAFTAMPRAGIAIANASPESLTGTKQWVACSQSQPGTLGAICFMRSIALRALLAASPKSIATSWPPRTFCLPVPEAFHRPGLTSAN